MNRLDKEFNKIVLDTVKELLVTSTESYEWMKLVILSKSIDDVVVYDYVQKLFQFTDRHRPLLIEWKTQD